MKKIGIMAGVLAATATALIGAAPSASADDCSYRGVVGTGGHHGVVVTCLGHGEYRGWAICKMSNGREYTHWGPFVVSPNSSTVWCDRDAFVLYSGYQG